MASSLKNQWIPLARSYEAERKAVPKHQPAPHHPLLDPPSSSSSSSSSSSPIASSPSPTPSSPLTPKPPAVPNPLSDDPLSQHLLESSAPPAPAPTVAPTKLNASVEVSKTTPDGAVSPADADTFVPWSAMKPGILSTYTTNEHLAIQVTFMNTQNQKVKVPMDKVQNRLEQLDQTEDDMAKQTLQVTQKDYINHIENLHNELIAAWDAEERVKALKLAIQCAKLLTDVSVMKFYPSKFVLITEILDTFGRLVYDRIKKRAIPSEADKKAGASRLAAATALLQEQAKETCRNWFFKIASIRELLPRIYAEMAILKCYEYLKGEPHTEFEEIITRIANMIRGVGNPLVAMYTRTYLSRKAHEVCPNMKDYVIRGFDDYLLAHKQFDSKRVETQFTEQKITYSEYLNLYSPALEWTLQCIAHGATQETLESILQKYTECKNAVVLNHIISSFPPEFISSHAFVLTKLIREADVATYPKHQLYRTLGVNLVLGKPPKDQVFPILNEVWKVVSKLENIEEYMPVTEVWVEFPLKNCGPREVNTILRDILAHVTKDRVYTSPTIQQQLQSIVLKVLSNVQDLAAIIAMDVFLPIFDLFSGAVNIQVSKAMLENFARNQGETTSDPVVINTMFAVGKTVHDSINSLSNADEVRQVSTLLVAFVARIDFGRDLEKHLQFFVDCRQAFANLDAVKSRLVVGALRLAVRALAIVKGRHTKKTSAYVRTCLAFCYITVPSMEDVFERLYLYLLSAECALLNNSLPQEESFLKAAITLVQEVPPVMDSEGQVKASEDQLVTFLHSFVALLVIVPWHPEHGAFFLTKGLIKVVKDYQWEKGSVGRVRSLVALLPLYASFFQQHLAYQRGESHDAMYGGDADFQNELFGNIDKLVDDILADLKQFGDEPDQITQKRAARVALDYVNTTVAFSELNAKQISQLIPLLSLAKKHLTSSSDSQYLKNTLQWLGGIPAAQELLKKS